MRGQSVRVLPEPAPAMIMTGELNQAEAAACSLSSPPSRSRDGVEDGRSFTEIAIQILLDHGADPNMTIARGQDWAALLAASHAGWPEVVRLLLKHGADATAVSSRRGWTPLHRLAWSGGRNLSDTTETARILLEDGVDRAARDAKGRTAWDLIWTATAARWGMRSRTARRPRRRRRFSCGSRRPPGVDRRRQGGQVTRTAGNGDRRRLNEDGLHMSNRSILECWSLNFDDTGSVR